jgi:hypothetical protein
MKTLTPVLLLCAALASCSSDTGTPPTMDLRGIEAITPQAQTTGAASRWDGVIEAVQQADLTAQTAGRVASVLVDVNDRVRSGQVLLRLSGVEQRAGKVVLRGLPRPDSSSQIMGIACDISFGKVNLNSLNSFLYIIRSIQFELFNSKNQSQALFKLFCIWMFSSLRFKSFFCKLKCLIK